MHVARPEISRNSKFVFDDVKRSFAFLFTRKIAQATTKITTVRIAEAKFEFTPSTLTFAKIAVKEAKKADNKSPQ